MMEGSQALADVENNGMRIDTDYLDRKIEWAGNKIKEYEARLREDDVYRIWRKRFGTNADIGSPQQLSSVLFDDLGYEVKNWTSEDESKRKPKMDEVTLEGIDIPFVKMWIARKKMIKARSTYLIGIRRETHNGFLHPVFNLHFVTTYRSSSDSPNFQNIPVRDPTYAKLIRRAFIPYDDESMLMEIDYGALEFRGAACFWKDPAMIAYASDPDLDIHRDMAAECYILPTDRVSKPVRGTAKTYFVFPELYGSYYGNIGRRLWERITLDDLKTADGTPIGDHLAEKGIRKLGTKNAMTDNTFLYHIKQVEREFNERFPHWAKAKEKWWSDYLKNGWFPLMTGFVCQGIYSINDVMNYPIQGPSFHLTLWSLIQLNKRLKQKKMRSRVIGQIHDSIMGNVYRSERDDYIEMATSIMTQEVKRHWDWVVTPLEIEIEASDTNWFEKKTLAL